MTLVSPLIHPVFLSEITFSGIPGWAQKDIAGSQRSGSTVWNCGSSMTIP